MNENAWIISGLVIIVVFCLSQLEEICPSCHWFSQLWQWENDSLGSINYSDAWS